MQVISAPPDSLNGFGGASWSSWLQACGDHFVALFQGDEVHIIDAKSPDRSVVSITGAKDFIAQENTVVIWRLDGFIEYWQYQDAQWCQIGCWPCPRQNDVLPIPELIKLSPSGVYLFISSSSPGSPDALHHFLYHAVTGDVIATFPNREREFFDFAILPNREEVLFGCVDELYGIFMLQCRTGKITYEYLLKDQEDFIHTDFVMADTNWRLLCFGCFWACPYRNRLYDATPLRESFIESHSTPLPLLLEDYGVLGGAGKSLPVNAEHMNDGVLDLVDILELSTLVKLQIKTDWTSVDHQIFQSLTSMAQAPHDMAAVVRHFDIQTGDCVGWLAQPIPITKETQVLKYTQGKMLLRNPYLMTCDVRTGATEVLADLQPHAHVCVTYDEQFVVAHTMRQ